MAKLKFINGTTIFSKFLNAIFGGGAADLWEATTAYAAGDVIELSGGELLRCIVAGTSDSGEPAAPGALRGTVVDGTVTWELFGGHLHDENDFDGSAPKVLLTDATEVTGTLPVANQVEHVHSAGEGQFAKIDPNAHVLGITTGDFDIVFGDSQFTSPQTCNVKWRMESNEGYPKLVKLSFELVTGTSSLNKLQSMIAGGTSENFYPIPAGLRPAHTFQFPIWVQDNSLFKLALLYINADGSIEFTLAKVDAGSHLLPQYEDFTTSGTKGFQPFVVEYDALN